MTLDTSLPQLRVITHSFIRLEGSDGTVIYVDPYRAEDTPHDATFVLITHAHFDHFSPEDIDAVKNSTTTLVAPATMAGDVARACIGDRVHLVEPEQTLQLGPLTIEAAPAYNTDPSRLGKHPQSNSWLGYVLTLDGIRYYVAGDTDQGPENSQIACDVALVPIGGTYTMDALQAAAFVNDLKPQVAVPIHFGCLVGTAADAETFAQHVNPSIDVVRKTER